MTQEHNSIKKKWREAVKNYQNPDIRRSIWQLTNTSILYLILWILLVFSLDYAYWITFLLTIPAGGMFARFFIIFHDCGHGSYFKASKANHWVGSILGVLVFTPYFYWRQSHAIHHATAGNLDKRGDGDVWTMTVEEYLGSTPWQRFKYKIYRNPLIMFGIGPLLICSLDEFISLGLYPNYERPNRFEGICAHSITDHLDCLDDRGMVVLCAAPV
jgi:omega-6 fatty acid desaturase (delta-12 desaturase)